MNPGNAGRALDVGCEEFLAHYSEYMDGRLSPVMAARLSSHATACASCARYDRVVRRGAVLVRELPQVAPSEEFELRLQHRIFHMQDAAALAPRATGAAAALGIAAAIALLAWSPLLLTRSGAVAPTAVSATPETAEVGVPLFQESAWFPMAMPTPPAHQRSTLLAAFPGPYSPLIVTPPVHRSVRSVSSESASID